jgi:YidC/Oxa1 family membrane protein insertase
MDRKILTAIVLSATTVLCLHYFFQPRKAEEARGVVSLPETVKPGQAYKVPRMEDLAKPVKREIDFVDKKRTDDEVVTSIETDLCSLSFSTYGGVLGNLDFKKHKGITKKPLRTIYPKTFYEQEQGCFLLALNEKTPYFYQLVGTEQKDDTIHVRYQVNANGWMIKKTFVIDKNSYQLKLLLEFNPTSSKPEAIAPRLFFASPFIAEIADDVIRGVVPTIGNDGVEKVYQGQELEQAWVMPSLFGSEDKYFVHTLINDTSHFTQRAFYKKGNHKTLFSILEGPEITAKQHFELNFYLGPKLLDELIDADSRLEGLLAFGWLSIICKFLLKLLIMIYSFIGNFGLAIILLTILIKIPFLPLSMKARKRMEEFQRYQPAINKLRQKYRGDMKRMQEELVRFYREHNISPASQMVGCLPLLIQMPILFALYRVLGNYLELYQAPFIGWIVDLSSKDPYYVLPLLMGASMFWQQKMTPVTDSRQRVTMMFMTVLFTALFAGFPAGLVLYWAVNNVLMIGEDYLRRAIM